MEDTTPRAVDDAHGADSVAERLVEKLLNLNHCIFRTLSTNVQLGRRQDRPKVVVDVPRGFRFLGSDGSFDKGQAAQVEGEPNVAYHDLGFPVVLVDGGDGALKIQAANTDEVADFERVDNLDLIVATSLFEFIDLFACLLQLDTHPLDLLVVDGFSARSIP